MITARVPAIFNDGRNPGVFWGDEVQYHAIRESALAACRRLQAGGAYGVPELAEYGVLEVTHAPISQSISWELRNGAKPAIRRVVDPEAATSNSRIAEKVKPRWRISASPG